MQSNHMCSNQPRSGSSGIKAHELSYGTCAYDTYGFGDIVLFGSGERMRIDGHANLLDVFLDYCVEMLYECFNPLSGWKTTLVSMIDLLEAPKEQYRQYLVDRASKKSEEKQKKEEENCDDKFVDKGRNAWKKVVNEILKQKQTKKKCIISERENHLKTGKKEESRGASQEKKNAQEAETCEDDPMTLE